MLEAHAAIEIRDGDTLAKHAELGPSAVSPNQGQVPTGVIASGGTRDGAGLGRRGFKRGDPAGA